MNMMYKNIIKEHYDELLAAGEKAYQRSLSEIFHEFIVWINPEGKVKTSVFEKENNCIPRNTYDDYCCEIFDFDGGEYNVQSCLDKKYDEIKNKEMGIVLVNQRKTEMEVMLYEMLRDAIDNVMWNYLNKTKLDGGGERYDDVGEDDDVEDEIAKLSTMVFNALEK